MTLRNIAIIGGGSLGNALAVNLSKKHRIHLVVRGAGEAAEMTRTRSHPRYLPGAKLPENVTISADLAAALENADLILIATPVSAFGEVIGRIAAIRMDLPVIWGCKGFCPSSGEPLSVLAEQLLGAGACFGVLSGPSFAEGLAANDPTALVVVTNSDQIRTLEIADAISNEALRVYANLDLIGVQICGAIKNVYAIAAGIIDGCGWGENTRAAMLTRAVAEAERYLLLHHGEKSTLMGLSGFGDIYLTCGSRNSRNYQVGMALASGVPLDRVLAELGHVAEGVNTTRLIHRRAVDLGLEMPLVAAVSAILDGSRTPQECSVALMARDIAYEAHPGGRACRPR